MFNIKLNCQFTKGILHDFTKIMDHAGYIDYNVSLRDLNLGHLGDFPLKSILPGLGRTGFGRDEIYPVQSHVAISQVFLVQTYHHERPRRNFRQASAPLFASFTCGLATANLLTWSVPKRWEKVWGIMGISYITSYIYIYIHTYINIYVYMCNRYVGMITRTSYHISYIIYHISYLISHMIE